MLISEPISSPGHAPATNQLPNFLENTGGIPNDSSKNKKYRVCIGKKMSPVENEQSDENFASAKAFFETSDEQSATDKDKKREDNLKKWAHVCKQKLATKAKRGKKNFQVWLQGILVSLEDSHEAKDIDNKSVCTRSTSTSILESEYRKLSYNVWAYGGVAIIGVKDMLGQRLRNRKEGPPRPPRIKKYSWRIPYTPLSPSAEVEVACIAPFSAKGTFVVHSVKHVRSR